MLGKAGHVTEAIHRTSGTLTGVYELDYLKRLRHDWPASRVLTSNERLRASGPTVPLDDEGRAEGLFEEPSADRTVDPFLRFDGRRPSRAKHGSKGRTRRTQSSAKAQFSTTRAPRTPPPTTWRWGAPIDDYGGRSKQPLLLYDGLGPSPAVGPLLAEIDEDPTGIFRTRTTGSTATTARYTVGRGHIVIARGSRRVPAAG